MSHARGTLIAVTGGIGSGKSTVSALLSERGATIIDADAIAREIVAPGSPTLARIAERFGPDMLTAAGTLDRAALAAVVFHDKAQLSALNSITHPVIAAETQARIDACGRPGVVIVHDIPLLTAETMRPDYQLVIAVEADVDVRVARLVRHRGMSENDARARIAKQPTSDERRRLADVVLDNNGDEDSLATRVADVWTHRIEPLRTI